MRLRCRTAATNSAASQKWARLSSRLVRTSRLGGCHSAAAVASAYAAARLAALWAAWSRGTGSPSPRRAAAQSRVASYVACRSGHPSSCQPYPSSMAQLSGSSDGTVNAADAKSCGARHSAGTLAQAPAGMAEWASG
eukprot:351853-Chlamydomonas_euryale.AAC.3